MSVLHSSKTFHLVISFLLQILKYCFSPSFFIYIVYRFCSFAFDNVLKVLIEETISMSPTD